MAQAPRLIIPQAPPQQRAERCETCRWRYKAPETKGDVECRFNPPTTYLQVQPAPPGAAVHRPGMQAMQLTTVSVFSVVRDDQFCGHWTPKSDAIS